MTLQGTSLHSHLYVCATSPGSPGKTSHIFMSGAPTALLAHNHTRVPAANLTRLNNQTSHHKGALCPTYNSHHANPLHVRAQSTSSRQMSPTANASPRCRVCFIQHPWPLPSTRRFLPFLSLYRARALLPKFRSFFHIHWSPLSRSWHLQAAWIAHAFRRTAVPRGAATNRYSNGIRLCYSTCMQLVGPLPSTRLPLRADMRLWATVVDTAITTFQ